MQIQLISIRLERPFTDAEIERLKAEIAKLKAKKKETAGEA